MANITNYLNKIKTAVYGKDVRGAIHDAIKQVYDDASVNHDNANMEVKMARGTHNTLNDRLDNVDEIQAQTNAQLSANRNNLQQQINELVLNSGGDSDLEVVQARTSFDGIANKTLNSRLNGIEYAIKTNLFPVEFAWEQGTIDVGNGGLHSSDTVIRTSIFCQIPSDKLMITIKEGYKVRGVIFDDQKKYSGWFNWSTVQLELEINPNYYYKFVICKSDETNITPDENTNVFFSIINNNYKDEESIKLLENEIKKKADMPTGFVQKSLSLVEGFLHGTNNVDWPSSNGAYAFHNVNPNDVIRVSGFSSSSPYPLVIMYTANDTVVDKYGNTNTSYTDQVITIPQGVYKICLNATNKNTIKLEILEPLDSLEDYIKTVAGEVVSDYENSDIYFELNNIYRRILRNEKNNDFTWKAFDKAYFAFVVDDCNSFTPTAYDVFHSANVPLSSAAIVSRLNNNHNGRTIKEVLECVIADGGEVLAHYSGSLSNSSTDEEWLSITREVKKTLEENGFEVRGIIRADSTAQKTAKGEKYCRLYFDYSDGLGKAIQYTLNRKFFIGVNTLEEMKAYIDQCCETPGFYPFCFHGNRDDEPLATEENLTEIINYIKSKGSSVAEISTYRDVYDQFGTTTLENRIALLESKF